MTKSEVVAQIAEASGLTKIQATAAYDATFKTLGDLIANGGSHTVPGFATFKAKTRAARQSRNPRTGEALSVPAKNTMAVTPTSGFVKSLNDDG